MFFCMNELSTGCQPQASPMDFSQRWSGCPGVLVISGGLRAQRPSQVLPTQALFTRFCAILTAQTLHIVWVVPLKMSWDYLCLH